MLRRTWWSRGSSAGGRRRFYSGDAIIASYRHVLGMAALVDAPVTARTVTQISTACVRADHIAQPDRSTSVNVLIAQ